MLAGLQKRLRNWLKPRPAPWTKLHSIERFQLLLERERARIDRRGGEFCVITFNFAAHPLTKAAQQHLALILDDRLRISDDAGYLADGRMAALLPDTPLAGAWKVAEDVRATFVAELPAPECSIYRYPDLPQSHPTHIPHGNDRAAKSPLSHLHREGNRPQPVQFQLKRFSIQPLSALFVRPMPLWKRTLDLLGASLGLILLTPLFLIVAAAIRISSPGPIFYTQKRSGRGGQPFEMVKFRSMITNADALKAALQAQNEQDGPAFKIKHDPRVTKIGRLIRKTSIDELPQLWNVLKGDMSLVGPRPLPVEETAGCQSWQKRRLDVTPGLTCIWQVKGRSKVTFDEWIRMDLEYIERRTLWSDLKLLFLTVPAVLLRKGAS